jgi:hypothetical protein
MLYYLVFRFGMIAIAAYTSARARYFPGLGAVFSMIYLTVAALASIVPPYPELPLKNAFADALWLYPALMVLLSLGPTIFALRASAREREDLLRARHLRRAGMAFLASFVLDLSMLAILLLGAALLARDA